MSEKFTWDAGDLVFDISDDDELFRAQPGYEDELEIRETERTDENGDEKEDS